MYEKKEFEMLQELLEAYGDAEQIQDSQESLTDNQLKSFSLIIEDFIRNKSQGTILDIGCGKGVLLPILVQLNSFLDNTKWFYLGAEYTHLHDLVLQLAVSLRLHRRCEVIDIDTLYNSWIDGIDVPLPMIVFVRNVLHELDIPKTSKLLHLLNNYMTPEDTLLIQDLLVFPKSERGNVCWDSDCLRKVFERLGFNVSLVTAKTRSGAQWFSAKVVKYSNSKILTIDEVTTTVAEERLAQLEKWRSVELLPHDTRIDKIAKIDFDLQIAALYKQLDCIGFLNPMQQQEKLVPDPNAAFQLALRSYDPSVLDRDNIQLPSINNFRDRANSQDFLEMFLNSQESVVVIQGGTSCGKTVLVSHVLSRRAHGRSIVPIDCEIAGDVWPILEQYLLAIGCRSSLEILSHEKLLMFKDLLEPLNKLVKNISNKSIVVFDHFERLLDPNGHIMNSEVCQFLSIIASANKAKMVITTRKEPLLHFLPESVRVNNEQPPVGRFPKGPHVENILDDYVDRAAIGLEEYPADLLDAIDRFPYLATLAGKLIAETGIAVTQDQMILRIIKSYLYDELAMRIITPEARPALKLACILRIPTPQYLYERIAGEKATFAAIETGLLFNIPDRHRNDLLSCASVLRDSETEFDSIDDDTIEETKFKEIHFEIAKHYNNISYETQGDPRWIREAHYHYLASGNVEDISEFGSLYKGELLWAGKTWFRRFRKYDQALEALLAVEEMGLRTYESRMLIAACLVRSGKREDGEVCYNELISDYPNQIGAKTSLVDSLIRIDEFNDALGVLDKFGFSMYGSNSWITGQYGRAYLGLHEYSKAAEAFKLQLQNDNKSPAIVYVRLAQSYFRFGDSAKAQETVTNGLSIHNDNPILSTLYYANMIRSGSQSDLKEAKLRLNELAKEYPRNGYILQKLVTASTLPDLPQVIAKLDRIHWQVEPSYLEKPVKISVLLTQKNFRKALEVADSLPNGEEYGEAIMRKIFLSWAAAEQTDEGKQSIAELGLKREVPQYCLKNVPILIMYAQLARIAGDNERFEHTLSLIQKLNEKAAEKVRNVKDLFDSWKDFDPEMP